MPRWRQLSNQGLVDLDERDRMRRSVRQARSRDGKTCEGKVNIDLVEYASKVPVIGQSVVDAGILATHASEVQSGGVIFEFAAQWGMSTAALCSGAKNSVSIVTSEKHPDCQIFLGQQSELMAVEIIQGDLRYCIDLIPERIDLLHCDALHDGPTAQWYIDHLWSRVVAGGAICIHDMQMNQANQAERKVVMAELAERGWSHWSSEDLPVENFAGCYGKTNAMLCIKVPK